VSDLHEKALQRSTLFVVTLSAFVTPLALSTVNVALPSIGREFGLSAIALGWIAIAYTLSAAMLLLPFGRIADIFGRKRIFIIGTAVFTAASAMLGLSNSAAMLIVFRAVQGIGAAMVFGTGIAILVSVYPVGERGRVLGINVATVYLGLSCGPFIGGLLTQHLGWRYIFFVNIPPATAIVLFALWKIKAEWAEARGEGLDLAGSILCALTIFLLMYGFSLLPTAQGCGFLAAGLSCGALFALWEKRAAKPILDLGLFSNRVFLFSNTAALIHYSATFGVSFLLSLYLQHLRGQSPQEAGLTLVAQPVMQALFSPLAGRLSDRMEPRVIASTGMGLTALGLFVLASVGQETGLPFIVGALMVLGIGFAFFSAPNTNAIMSSVRSRHYSAASSMVATMRLLGQMMSVGLAMITFTFYMGRTELRPETYPLLLKAVRTALTAFGCLCAVGVFASLTRGNLRANGGKGTAETE
jgi:EmrB/QacA subfamily drug resistance transporter